MSLSVSMGDHSAKAVRIGSMAPRYVTVFRHAVYEMLVSIAGKFGIGKRLRKQAIKFAKSLSSANHAENMSKRHQAGNVNVLTRKRLAPNGSQ